tara:strand:+ start:600 stop:743 length:144 start_codon:yes stop_codon:yes gene_type:complete
MEIFLIFGSALIIWLNWRIYIVSKELLDVSIDVLDETIKMKNLIGGE